MNDWEPLRPGDAAMLLPNLDAPWWIAGVWSLDPGPARDWDPVAPKLDAAACTRLVDAVAVAPPESPHFGRL